MSQGIIEPLIDELTKLPGIGRKSAQRLAFFILGMQKHDALAIAQAIINVKENARFCSQCFNITDEERCHICTDPARIRSLICVVEEPADIVVIERTKIHLQHENARMPHSGALRAAGQPPQSIFRR